MYKIARPNLRNLSFPSSNFAKDYKGKEERTRQYIKEKKENKDESLILETLEGTSKWFSCEVLSPVEPNEIILVYS